MDEEKKQKYIKWGIILVAILLILWIITLFFGNKNTGTAKIDSYIKELASYTLPGSTIQSTLFEVKFATSDAKAVNEDIAMDYDDAVKRENTQFTYGYSLGKKYLSVVSILNQLDKNGNPYPVFKTYVFNKKTGERLSDDELLAVFSKTKEELALSFENVMKTYYEEEKKSEYFAADECDYTCFLGRRGVANYEEGIQLFVENDKLKYYRSFATFSDWGEEQFYRNEDFLFDVE